jgi:hypothetical protein
MQAFSSDQNTIPMGNGYENFTIKKLNILTKYYFHMLHLLLKSCIPSQKILS